LILYQDFYDATYPPSTGIVTPLINFEAGDAKNTAVPASSSGSDHLLVGKRLITKELKFSSSRPPLLISVLIHPGAIALTRMPSSA
jgi:hypothetical protein